MNFRLTLLALPVALGLAAVAADAEPVALAPLGSAHHDQVAALGATCANPYTPAEVAFSNLTYPAAAQALGVEGVATVGISLLPNGHVTHAWLIKSTGNAMLDRAAVDSGYDSRYVAERSQCASIAGDYRMEAVFSRDR